MVENLIKSVTQDFKPKMAGTTDFKEVWELLDDKYWDSNLHIRAIKDKFLALIISN